MNDVWIKIVDGFAGNPAMLLLALLLAGGGYLGYKVLRSSQAYTRKREEELLTRLIDHTGSMATSMKEVKEEIKELRTEITEVIGDLKDEIRTVTQTVAVHEVRIAGLERKDS